MNKAIFYKEWIKSRKLVLVSVGIFLDFSAKKRGFVLQELFFLGTVTQEDKLSLGASF